MRCQTTFKLRSAGALAIFLGAGWPAPAQETARFTSIQPLTNREVVLRLSAPAGLNLRIEATPDFADWTPLTTLLSKGSDQLTDAAAPYLDSRFYRTTQLTGTNILTGDHLATPEGEVIFHPINHATFVFAWNGMMIYNDPVGSLSMFQGLPRADLVLVSHSHGDHFSASTIEAVRSAGAVIIAPQAVYNSLSAALRSRTIVLTNNAATNVLGLAIQAIPAYNLTTSSHPRGQGNGYVLTIGGKRIYISGDTEDIPEMRALSGIEVAFVCMNVPFTMSVDKAASAVRQFRPRIIYPYHYRNQGSVLADVNAFKRQVGTDLGVEVRLRSWY